MALVGSMVVTVTAQTQPLQQGMAQAANSIKQVQQTVMTAQGTITGLERSLTNLAAQYIGLQQLVNAMKSLVQAGREMELLKITASNVFGGQQEASTAIEKMSVLAERLGINFKDLVRGYTNVTAASRGTKVEGAETEKMFSQLVSITRALGQSSDQTAGSILAVQQILTKGTIMAEEFRGQLGERLPGILQAGAKTMGTSLEGFSKMMERGELGARALVAIINTMFADVGRKAEAAAGTFDAASARMNTAWIKLGEALMSGGTGAALKFIADRFTEIIRGAEIVANMIPGTTVKPSLTVAELGKDVPVAPETIPAVKAMEQLRTKGRELGAELGNLERLFKTLVDPKDIANVRDRMTELRVAIDANVAALTQQETIMRGIIELSIGAEIGKRIDEFAKQDTENATKRLQIFLDQADVLLNQFDTIRNDTRRRSEMMPAQKEVFARDALSESKKILDTVTSLVAKIRELMSITPNVTQPMREAQEAVEQRARDAPKFIQDQKDIITSLEQIEDLYRRIGRIREENETMTKGREEAQVEAEARARKLQLEVEEAKRQFLINPTVGSAMAQSALEFALADQQQLINDAARTTIKEFGTKEFDDLHLKLLQQADDLDRGTKSWAEMRASVANLKPELQSILDLDLERIRIRRELNQMSEDNAKRERELADVYDSVRDEIDQLILTEDELFRKRASRATEAPFSRVTTPMAEATELQSELSAMFERARFSIPEELSLLQNTLGVETARKAIKDLQKDQNATVNDTIRGLFDQNRALRLTTEELLDYELALNNADDAQKDLAKSLLNKNKIAEFASGLSDFVMDFATQDVFDLIKGQPVDAGMQQDRLRLQFLKEDIAKAEAQLAMISPTTPAMREQIRKQTEQLTDFRREYTMTQEEIRQETAKTETVFEQYIRKLSQFLLRLFIDSSEANKQLTNLLNKGIQAAISLVGAAGSLGSVTAGNIDVGTTAVVAGAEGVTTPPPLIFKQHGGTFFKGQPMMVGEAGPELVFPLVPGVVLTNRQTQAALSAGISNVTFNIYAQDAPSVIQSRGAISRALVSAITQAQRNL